MIKKILKHTKSKIDNTSPVRIILLSYLPIIILGGILLFLPISQNLNAEKLSFFDCLFTSTSASSVVCIGIVPFATQWSVFGKIIILILIQIGGLSVIALTHFLFILLGRKLGFKDKILLQNVFNQSNIAGMSSMTKLIIKGTLLFEGIGSIILTFYFFIFKHIKFKRALFYGVFHSISAFCNAGVDILPQNGLIDYKTDWCVNLVIMVLITIGAIGFAVWQDIIEKIKNKKHRFSLGSKLAINFSLFLIIAGTISFFVLEYNNPKTMQDLSIPNKLLASMFQAISLRSAGFSTLNQYELSMPSRFISYALMFIGGSPSSMAGGVETITILVIFYSLISTFKGYSYIKIKNRSLSLNYLQQAVVIVTLFLSTIAILAFSIYAVETAFNNKPIFNEVLHEAFIIITGTGMSIGVSENATSLSKIFIMLGMMIARVGPVTIVYALTKRSFDSSSIKYPQENILI